MPTANLMQNQVLPIFTKNDKLTVKINDELKVQIPNNKLGALIGILECDPRPAYQNDESRIYGISFANMNIKFKVSNRILTVTDIEKIIKRLNTRSANI